MNPIATSSSNTSTWMPNGLPKCNGALPPPMNDSNIINGTSEWKWVTHVHGSFGRLRTRGKTNERNRYEMRREAQLIIPGLYLGPFQASLNSNKMKQMGITHVSVLFWTLPLGVVAVPPYWTNTTVCCRLCIRDRKEVKLIFPRFPQEFKYMTLDISDHPVCGHICC